MTEVERIAWEEEACYEEMWARFEALDRDRDDFWMDYWDYFEVERG